jgi:hypothetical protein
MSNKVNSISNGGNAMSTDLLERIETAVVEDQANGIYRCR